MEMLPLAGTLQLGDVPRTQLTWPRSQELGLGVGTMGELVAPRADLRIGPQDAVEGGHRGQIPTRIEQASKHGAPIQDDILRRVQQPANDPSLGLAESGRC